EIKSSTFDKHLRRYSVKGRSAMCAPSLISPSSSLLPFRLIASSPHPSSPRLPFSPSRLPPFSPLRVPPSPRLLFSCLKLTSITGVTYPTRQHFLLIGSFFLSVPLNL